jgi:EmrB/QacA subfamily drug resistance transporter
VSDAAAIPLAAPRSPDSIKRWTLVATILGSSIALLDSTVVNVALPSIQRSLGGGLAGQEWVTNAYMLTLASLILVGGSLGDIFGERRVFALGVGGFGIASLLCAIAPTIELLIAFRALQGVAGALLTPSSLAVIVATFSEEERGPAVGTWTAWGSIAAALGPLIGGELLNVASWRWIFVLNLPLVVICVLLIWTFVPASSGAGERPRVDLIGALLCTLGLGGTVLAFIEKTRSGFSDPVVFVPLATGVALLAAFIAYEARAREPMLPLSLFRRRNFGVGNLETFAVYGGLSVLFFYLILYLQQVGGYTPLKSGLALLPPTIVMFLLARRFGALSDRYGPRLFMGIGPLVEAAGLFLFMDVGTRVHYLTEILPAAVLLGLGLAITVAPLTAAILAGVDQHRAGIASATNNAVARAAGLLATVAVGAVMAAQFSSALNHHLAAARLGGPAHAAVTQAKHLTLGVPALAGVPPREARLIERAAQDSSRHAFVVGMGIAGVLVALGGAIGAAGIRKPRRFVCAEECPGGQLAGAPREAARPRRTSEAVAA